MRLGDKGFKVLKPGEDIGIAASYPAVEAEVDAGDGIEDYDENV